MEPTPRRLCRRPLGNLLDVVRQKLKSMAVPVLRQESVVLAFRKLFPAPWFDKYQFAMVEDIINSPPSVAFPSGWQPMEKLGMGRWFHIWLPVQCGNWHALAMGVKWGP